MDYIKTLFNRNFLEYASYVIRDRAIPDLEDGLKPVQRRILHTLFEMDDGKFHKVANVVGQAELLVALAIIALLIALGLSRLRLNGIGVSIAMIAIGIAGVWILGARLTYPLLGLGRAILAVVPQIVPALRSDPAAHPCDRMMRHQAPPHRCSYSMSGSRTRFCMRTFSSAFRILLMTK